MNSCLIRIVLNLPTNKKCILLVIASYIQKVKIKIKN